MSAEEAREPVEGDGYAVANLDGLGEGYGFRKIRTRARRDRVRRQRDRAPGGHRDRSAHATSASRSSTSSTRGRVEIEFGDGTSHRLGPGGVARVDAPTVRKIRNHGPEDAVYVVVGAEGGYVGRDGRLPEGDDGNPRPISG